MSKFDARLYGWQLEPIADGFIIRGTIYDDSKKRFFDGEVVRTSYVTESPEIWYDHATDSAGLVFQTRNTRYFCVC